MPPAKIAAPAAVLGGALWIVQAALGGGDGPLSSVLYLAGVACLMVAGGLFGAGLVRSNARAMRVTTGVASALLVLSLVEAFRPAGSAWYNGFWGALAVVVGGVALLRSRRSADDGPTQGAHAR